MLQIKLCVSLFLVLMSSVAFAEDLEIIPSYDIGIAGVGDINTISTGPDNGANANMRRLFWNSMGHATTEGAVNNFLSRLPLIQNENFRGAGNLNIGGHGNEGFLETGAGQTGPQDYFTNIMAVWNSFLWAEQFKKLNGKSYPILYIYSCHTGAGERGADFLYDLANATNKPAAARTGFTYSSSNGLSFEKGSTWQIAFPGVRPTPIPAPTPHFTESSEFVELYVDKQVKSLRLDDITDIAIESSHVIKGNKNKINIDKALRRSFVFNLFGTKPYSLPGEPTAQITAKVTLTVKVGKKEKQLNYLILNDRLVVADDKVSAHYVRPAITDFY